VCVCFSHPRRPHPPDSSALFDLMLHPPLHFFCFPLSFTARHSLALTTTPWSCAAHDPFSIALPTLSSLRLLPTVVFCTTVTTVGCGMFFFFGLCVVLSCIRFSPALHSSTHVAVFFFPHGFEFFCRPSSPHVAPPSLRTDVSTPYHSPQCSFRAASSMYCAVKCTPPARTIHAFFIILCCCLSVVHPSHGVSNFFFPYRLISSLFTFPLLALSALLWPPPTPLLPSPVLLCIYFFHSSAFPSRV